MANAGDDIRVAAGLYTPAPPGGPRTTSFQLVNDVGLYGGYAGIGTPDPDLRDVDSNATILSGDLNGDDGPGPFDNNDENSYHVVTGSGTSATAILDGFTITAGNANDVFPDDCGGGMYNYYGNPTVTDCTFSGNTSTSTSGGMYNCTDSSPTLMRCAFSGNSAGYAGAMHVQSRTTLVNCTFNGNSANMGGGMLITVVEATLINCIFNENSAGSNGGGIWNNSHPTLISCVFNGNSADDGGGMFNDQGSNPTLVNCGFVGNSADNGGGIRNSQCSPTMVNCTFSWNDAELDGGGMFNDQIAAPTLTNCIFWGNRDSGGTDESAQVHPYQEIPDINYCCVQGWTGTWGGIGNTGDNPLFIRNPDPGPDGNWNGVDDDYGDLHLQPGSPCIDAASNSLVPSDTLDLNTNGDTEEPIPFDLDGNPRLADGDADGESVVDMGVYEFSLDCNSNGIPDAYDIANGTSEDCNSNGVPDECDLADGTSLDCSSNSIPDECDIAAGTGQDFDGDGLLDECDPDIDGDGVFNDSDPCDFSPPGQPTNPSGGPMGDIDDDCEVTVTDYLYFSFCLSDSGPGNEPVFQNCIDVFDFDFDDDVDLGDFAAFQNAFTGS